MKDLFYIQINSLYGHFIKCKNKFKLQNDNIDKKSIEILLPLSIKKQLNSIKNFSKKLQLLSPSEIYIKLKSDLEFKEHKNESDNCPICMDNFYEIDFNKDEKKFEEILKKDKKLNFEYNVIMLDDCQDHYFHLECILNLKGEKEFIKCPICFNIYGIQTGDQPAGSMIAFVDKKNKCASYENCDTIVIYYNLPCGHSYSGTRRVAYLPANDKGWEVLGLLKVCFDRKLIFTVGTSVTTGATNTVVWSGIHHKTNLNGGILKIFLLKKKFIKFLYKI
jgi:deltex-like protein